MKKAMMILAMLAIPFAMQAQSKFHDVELNEAAGPVKSIATTIMGRAQDTSFSKEGKMEREGISERVYDAEGYMQSAKIAMMGQEPTVKYAWEKGKIAGVSMNMMGRDMTIKYVYDEKGVVASQTMNIDGQDISAPYSDYKFDAHGNWISRKLSLLGQEMEQTRTIEYFE